MRKSLSSQINLEFCDAGIVANVAKDWTHRKTVPYTIVAQVLNGAYEITCDGRHEVIREGESFLTPADKDMTIIHRYGPKPDRFYMEARWLHFHFTYLGAIDLTSLYEMPLKISKFYERRVGDCMTKALDAKNNHGMGLQETVRLNSAAYDMMEIIMEISQPDSLRMERLDETRRFAPVFDFIRRRIAKEINVADMARQVNMSSSHFHQVFREIVGCSPMHYLKSTRLRHAGVLLLKTDLPLAEIAFQTGFKNQFHFCREFKKAHGLPPSVYRERNVWS